MPDPNQDTDVKLARIYTTATLALLLAATACGTDSTGPNVPKIEETTFAPSLGITLSTFTKTASGLYWKDLVVGAGSGATVGKKVSIHYVGSLPDGTQFDANGPTATPFSFTIGAGQVIGGFDEGLRGMAVGGKRQLIIPPNLAYGSQAVGPIPANSILVFTIDLVAIQ